jgi:hypothetical protein
MIHVIKTVATDHQTFEFNTKTMDVKLGYIAFSDSSETFVTERDIIAYWIIHVEENPGTNTTAFHFKCLCFFSAIAASDCENHRLLLIFIWCTMTYGQRLLNDLHCRGLGFVDFVWFGSSPPPPSASSLSFSIFLCVAGRTYWRKGWGGAKPYDG